MDTISRRLGASRGLLILFGTVVALPAATLVFLGVRPSLGCLWGSEGALTASDSGGYVDLQQRQASGDR